MLANDSSAYTTPLTVSAVTQGLHGTVTITNGGSSLFYTPASGYTGSDTFTYTASDGHGGTATANVNVTVLLNRAPTANDDSSLVAVGYAKVINVLANDSDPDGDALTVTAVTQGAYGSVTISGNGASVTYTPATGYAGTDSFSYTISDGYGGTATANVNVTVQPDRPPVASDDTVTSGISSPTNINVLANDSDPDEDALTVTAVTQGAHGSVAISGNGTSITYTPNGHYAGTDNFSYTISDGYGRTATANVTVNLAIINVAVVGGTSNDSGFQAIAAQLNDHTYFNFNATVVPYAQLTSVQALSGYDAVVIGNNGTPGGDGFGDASFTSALRQWVQSGHGVVATGWTVYGAGPSSTGRYSPDIYAIVPVNTSYYYGAYDGGSVVQPNGVSSPITAGVQPFAMSGGDDIEYAQGGVDSGATVLATTNGQATVVSGQPGSGRSVYLGPIYSAATGYNNAELRSGSADRLLEQAVAWTANFTSSSSAPPTAESGGPYTTEFGTAVTLDGSASSDPNGDPLTYTWNFGDGSTYTESPTSAPDGTYDGRVQHTYSQLGSFTVSLTVTDSQGGSNTASTTVTIRDTTPPATTASLSGNQGTNGWYTGPVTVNLSATDTGSGVATTYYRIGSSGSFSIYNAAQPPVISADGSTTVYFYSVDTSNNSEGVQSITVNLDQTAPQVGMTGPATNSYTNNNQPTLTATASDATPGVASVQFQISSDGITWSAVSGTVSQNGNLYSIQVPNALPDGSYQARAVATDAAGNSTTSATVSFTVDTVPPGITNVTDVPDPFSPNGDGINDSTTISYTLSEASNVTVALSDASSNPIRTLLNSVAQAAGAQSVVWDGKNDSGTVVADGTYTYDVTATDPASNTTNSVTLANTDHTVTVDNTPPTVSITVEPPDPTNVNLVRFTFAGTDNFTTSTNLVFQYSLDGSNYWTIPSNGNTLSLSGLADGRYTLSVRSVDEAGNISAPTSYSWTVDTTAPKTTEAVSGTQGNAGWYTAPATVTLSADDSNGSVVVSGVDQTYFSVDGGPQQTYTAPFTLSTDGQHTVVYWSADKAGNVETPHKTLNVNIDQTAPTISGAPTIGANADGWYNGPVTVHFSATDPAPGSGVASVRADTTLTGEGANQSVTGTAVDVAGNSSSTTVSGINIDLTPPTTTATPNITPNAIGWNNTDVMLTLTAADNLSGVKATYYTVDGGATQPGSSLTLSQGIHTVEFWSVDRADNAEAHQTITVRIDETAPTISVGRIAGYEANANGWNNGMVVVSYTASDSLSGLPAGTETGGSTFFIEGAGQSQTFTVTDLAGNSASATVSDINIDLTPPTISASATTADGNSYTPGTWTNQAVTVHYTTSDALSGIASSPVDQVFGEGDNQTSTATVSDLAGNSATAGITGIEVDQTKPTVNILSHPDSLTNDTSANFTFSGDDNLSGVDHLEYSLDGSNYTTGNSASFSNLADGNHTFSVEAIDEAGNVSAPATFSWVIDTTTTTSLSSSENASTYGDSVTFTARVSNAATTVTGGTVKFEDGSTVLDTENLDSTGHASFTLDTLNAATHHLTAVFSGSANGTELFQGSSGNLDQQVNKADATVTPTNYSGTYDALAHTASVVITGVGGSTDVLAQNSLTETNAGSYSVSASISGMQNYNDVSGTATINVGQALATVSVTNYSGTYDAQAHTASVVVTGVDGESASNAITQTNAGGPNSVSAALSDPGNYSNASTGTATIDIAKATPSLSLSSVATTYDSNSHSATATATGVNGATVSVSFNYVYYVLNSDGSFGTQLSGAPINPGSYEEVATFTSSDSNYSSGGTVQNTITIADKFGAYLPPVSLNMNLVEGRTVPIKFQLTDANGKAITSTSGITLNISLLNSDGSIKSTTQITSSNGLVYNSGQFQYNWQTPKVAGSYTLSISSGGVAVPGSAKTLSIVAPGNSAAGLETDSSGGTSTAGALLGGEVDVYVDNSNGDLTSDELARVQDAVNAVQTTVAPFGVTIVEVADSTQSNVTLNMDTTTSLGGFADGVLGCTTNGSQVTMVQGWNWYAGADPTQVGSGQYDFETAVIHELGHVLGLGHSSDSNSVMYATLGTGTANRTLVAADLNVPDDGGSCALHAVPIAATSSQSNGQSMTPPSSTSIPSSNPMSVTDQLFAELAGILSAARNAYQSELASVSALWQQADALALQRLDALLSMNAGAMGVTKDSLMRDLLFASSFSDKGV